MTLARISECRQRRKFRTTTRTDQRTTSSKPCTTVVSFPVGWPQSGKKTTKMKAGRQERQRELVNNAIDRKDNGKLMVNTDKPMFAELQARFLPSCFTLSTHVGFCVISTCTGSFLVCYMIYRAVSHCTIIGLYMSVI